MKKLITMFAIGALAAGSAFAEKGEGGDKPKGDRPPHAEGEKGRGEKGKGGPGGLIKALDKDGSGDVSFDEFKAGPRAEGKPEEKVKSYFDKMDKDSDGKISRADLEAMMKEKGKGKGEGGDRPERPKGKKKGEEKAEKKGGE